MEYCSEQLSKFDIQETNGEEEDMETELQCLPEDLAMAISSVKRSLIDSMDNAESEKKKKLNIKDKTAWGHVLINRPRTRDHGSIKITDKANAYLLKNLEVPTTFKGKSFVVLNNEVLASHTSMVGLRVGDNSNECDDIITDLVAREKIKCLQFADSNPEIVLPNSIDLDFNNDSSPIDTKADLVNKDMGTVVLELDSPAIIAKSQL